jgi:hypothetical protein
MTIHRCFLHIPSGFREDLKKSAIQKQKLPVVAMFVKGSGQNEQSYRGHSIDTSYQVSVHLAKRFQRRFSKIGISETRIACGGHIC